MTVHPDNFWPGFGNDTGLPEIICDDDSSLSQAVLSYYDIPCSDSTGGSLPDLDIKHMDAMQVIKLSLLEASANDGRLYEPIMNSEGSVEFKAVGEYPGSVNDIYYEIQTGSYNEGCSGVMITGKTPMAYRRPINWLSAWQAGDMDIYDAGVMFNSKCMEEGFNQYCTIVYNDPQLTSTYEDGIVNLYEIDRGNPHDAITGYAHYIGWNNFDEILDKNVNITQSNSTKVLLKLESSDGVGILRKRPPIDPDLSKNLSCYENEEEADWEDGAAVLIPDNFRFDTVRGVQEDKLVGIDSIYVVGLAIDLLWGEPPTNSDSVKKDPEYGSANTFISISNTHDQVFPLSRGEHFAVAYKNAGTGDPVIPYIVFADNSLITDPVGPGAYIVRFKVSVGL